MANYIGYTLMVIGFLLNFVLSFMLVKDWKNYCYDVFDGILIILLIEISKEVMKN